MHYRLLIPFSYGYSGSQLLEQDFFPEGTDLEIDKILRYIYIPAHSHDFVEFTYVVEGTCEHTINGQRFTQERGDFVVVSPGAKHIVTVPEDCLCMTIKMKRTAFYELYLPNVAVYTTPLLFACDEDEAVLAEGHGLAWVARQVDGAAAVAAFAVGLAAIAVPAWGGGLGAAFAEVAVDEQVRDHDLKAVVQRA